MDRLRTPFLIVALVIFILIVAGEFGASWFGGLRGRAGLGDDAPALGIPSLALIDGLLVFTVILIALPLLLPERIHGRTQGIVTLIVSILALIGAFVLAIKDLVLLMIMVSLLLAAPFGTIAYLVLFGDFPTGAAGAMLATLMTLKLIGVVMLVLAQQGFLKNKGLVLIVLTTLLAYLILGFLHAIVPLPLVSITDAIGGIIGCILAIIWALILLIASLPAIVKAIL